jgi:hypothetical protein
MEASVRHYEARAIIEANPADVFAYVDDHEQFSSHMGQSSWMMGGGHMRTSIDDGHGQHVGSHMRMSGRVFGFRVELDEVVTAREAPRRKTWETVGDVRLLVVGHYRMGIEVRPQDGLSLLHVSIEYDLPKIAWLGRILGGMYARWCVRQMVRGAQNHFTT